MVSTGATTFPPAGSGSWQLTPRWYRTLLHDTSLRLLQGKPELLADKMINDLTLI